MEKIYQIFPQELFTFVLVTLFSLLIGLSQRKLSLKKEGEGIDKTFFGTDRTFTFIGILGYLLYILDPVNLFLFMGGGLALIILLGLNYYVKMSQHNIYGITSIITGLITYCLAPIGETQPSWFYIMLVVTVLLFTEMKSTFTEIAQHMQNDEMITLAKVDTVANRRLAFDRLRDRDVVTKLFNDLGKRSANRPGGYTRILKMGFRVGDNAPMALIELVDRAEISAEAPAAE